MQKRCVIWPSEIVETWPQGLTSTVESPRAGGLYEVHIDAIGAINQFQPSQRAQLTTWIVNQHRLGIPRPTVTQSVLAELKTKRALRFGDKKRRFFEALVSLNFMLGNEIFIEGEAEPEFAPTLSAWTECQSDDQLSSFMHLLEDEALVVTGDLGWRLTSSGYHALEQAEVGGADTRQAFVAMWFSDKLKAAYDIGIDPAIRETGFEPLRIDRKEHNNKIDDEIIAEIRRSRFVVADFTCGLVDVDGEKQPQARGGVYYEAGFAQGLGTPVIWTVRDDCVDLVHFDTRQFAHIVWSNPTDLKAKLLNRIRATIPGSA